MQRLFAALCVLLACASAQAQGTLEIIPLRHRTAEQVLPLLRPFLEPGGVLSAQSNQLIVRTSPANLKELQAALAAIDTPVRRLVISVRIDSAADAARASAGAGINVSGRPAAVPRASIEAHAVESRSSAGGRSEQRIQVIEGGRAFIATGQSRPIVQRQFVRTPGGGSAVQETTTVQDVNSGFEVVPHLAGTRVLLEISQRRQTPGAAAGSVQAERAATTVELRLGEWTEIAALGASDARADRGGLSGAVRRGDSSERIWIKVEEQGS